MTTENCSRLLPLTILSRKWSFLTLRMLKKSHSFSELKHALRFITSRVLSKELSALESDGLIKHEDTLYSLTAAGTALLAAAEPLMQWSVAYRGLHPCPEEQSCARCASYAETVSPPGRLFHLRSERQ
jgi:DNA-binding HxlR family transcriptional regulator